MSSAFRASCILVRRKWSIFLWTAAAFLLYFPILGGGFIADDFPNLAAVKLGGPASLWWTRAEVTNFFRPLTGFLTWTEWQLFGNNPALYYAVNIALHGCVAYLLARAVYLLLLGRVPNYHRILLAAIVGTAFLVYPTAAATVGWISCLGDLLAALFFLLAVILLLKYLVRGVKPVALIGVFVLFFLAFASKESAVGGGLAVGLCLLLGLFVREGKSLRTNLLVAGAVLLCATGIYLFCRVQGIGSVIGGYSGDMHIANRLTRTLLTRTVVLRAGDLFFPNLNTLYFRAGGSSHFPIAQTYVWMLEGVFLITGIAWVRGKRQGVKRRASGKVLLLLGVGLIAATLPTLPMAAAIVDGILRVDYLPGMFALSLVSYWIYFLCRNLSGWRSDPLLNKAFGWRTWFLVVAAAVIVWGSGFAGYTDPDMLGHFNALILVACVLVIFRLIPRWPLVAGVVTALYIGASIVFLVEDSVPAWRDSGRVTRSLMGQVRSFAQNAKPGSRLFVLCSPYTINNLAYCCIDGFLDMPEILGLSGTGIRVVPVASEVNHSDRRHLTIQPIGPNQWRIVAASRFVGAEFGKNLQGIELFPGAVERQENGVDLVQVLKRGPNLQKEFWIDYRPGTDALIYFDDARCYTLNP